MYSARPLLRRTGATLAALVMILVVGVPVPADGLATGDDGGDAQAAAWAFDPAQPGPDRPPLGRSLFDHLFVTERHGAKVYDVPFPFAALRQRIVEHLAAGVAGPDGLAQVLIPLGRALQRNAAAPDFFPIHGWFSRSWPIPHRLRRRAARTSRTGFTSAIRKRLRAWR